MKKLIKELFSGLKWVFIPLVIIVLLASSWVGAAWSLGWLLERLFDLKNFSSKDFISFGSWVLSIALVVQIITIVIISWILLALGKVYKKNGLL